MPLSREDQILDRIWRERFGQPMPMTGAAGIVRAILIREGVPGDLIDKAMRAKQSVDP